MLSEIAKSDFEPAEDETVFEMDLSDLPEPSVSAEFFDFLNQKMEHDYNRRFFQKNLPDLDNYNEDNLFSVEELLKLSQTVEERELAQIVANDSDELLSTIWCNEPKVDTIYYLTVEWELLIPRFAYVKSLFEVSMTEGQDGARILDNICRELIRTNLSIDYERLKQAYANCLNGDMPVSLAVQVFGFNKSFEEAVSDSLGGLSEELESDKFVIMESIFFINKILGEGEKYSKFKFLAPNGEIVEWEYDGDQ